MCEKQKQYLVITECVEYIIAPAVSLKSKELSLLHQWRATDLLSTRLLMDHSLFHGSFTFSWIIQYFVDRSLICSYASIPYSFFWDHSLIHKSFTYSWSIRLFINHSLIHKPFTDSKIR